MYWILTVRNSEEKTDLFISSHFFVGEKVEQGMKINKCALAEGRKGQL